MHWGNGFVPKKQQQQQSGWNTTSDDYHSHITKIERIPSVLNETPRYPNVHKALNNKYSSGNQEQESTQHEVVQDQIKKSSPKATAKKKVQVTDRVEFVESAKDDDDDDNYNKNSEVRQDTVDIQADGFIQWKRKGFELCKWKTFKLN